MLKISKSHACFFVHINNYFIFYLKRKIGQVLDNSRFVQFKTLWCWRSKTYLFKWFWEYAKSFWNTLIYQFSSFSFDFKITHVCLKIICVALKIALKLYTIKIDLDLFLFEACSDLLLYFALSKYPLYLHNGQSYFPHSSSVWAWTSFLSLSQQFVQ